mgnify:CR=1 FL=1
MKTLIIRDNIEEAARLIQSGELVAVPTETVYGLAGNGLDEKAVEQIYEVKGRPQVKPLALMVPSSDAMELYCEEVPEQAKSLAEKFWPGPLSIVLKSKDIVPDIVRAGGDTVSLRCPKHDLTLELLRKAALPLAAPSANPSGEESPKNAERVMQYFDGKIAAVIDGGECGIGTESTIIDMSRSPYKILRQGALPEDEIRAALVQKLKIIGITGGTGGGKTTVLKELAARGALIVDCDEIYHEMLKSDTALLADIGAEFSGVISDGKLDRKKLGGIVFADEEKLNMLNAITHSHIIAQVESLLSDWAMNGGTLAAIDAIALIKSGIAARCDAVIGVIASPEKRIERIMQRDNIGREYAEKRVRAQKDNSFFEANCDKIIRNDGTKEELIAQIKNTLKEVI